MTSILKTLEKKFGVTKTIGGGASLEQCLFLILREGWDFKKASKAVRMLESEYIDWNEVRVSSMSELSQLLASLKCADMEKRVVRLKQFLDTVTNEFNELDSEMFKSMDFEPLRRFVLGAEALGKANAYILLQCYKTERIKKPGEGDTKDKVLVVSPESMRVAIRLGVIKKTQSAIAARKAFMKLLKPADFLRFQSLMAQHGEKLCFTKNPLCVVCFFNDSWKFFKGL
jgi:endonuclease III